MTKYLFRHKWYILAVLVLIIVEPSITSWIYFWLQQMYNTVVVGISREYILWMICVGVLVWIAKRVLLFCIGVVRSRFVCNIKQDLKDDLFFSILGLNTGSLSRIASSGEYISLFTNDITILEQKFFSTIITLCSNVISIVILGASFLVLDRTLAVLVFIFNVLAMFVPVFFSQQLSQSNLSYSEKLSTFTQRLKEYFSAFFTIKNYSIEDVIGDKFSTHNQSVENAKFNADYSLSLANSIGSLLTWFSRILVIGVGLILVSRGEMLLGTVIVAQGFTEELSAPMQSVVECVNSIYSVRKIVDKLNVMTGNGVEQNVPAQSPPILPNYDVSFENICVSAGKGELVHHFSFTFKAGKKYLIIGKNGAGKSSLFRAMKRGLEVSCGTICIGGRPVSSMSNGELSRLISYLNENVTLFTGSVFENIQLFRPYQSHQLDQAVTEAQVNLSLDKELGDDGYNISSGERRRIEIARSILTSAKILVFDEVVSTLDIETAYEIEKLALGFKDKTAIFISHNFSGKLIRQYDEILLMENGALVAHGPYEQLLQTSPYFRRVCDIKFG